MTKPNNGTASSADPTSCWFTATVQQQMLPVTAFTPLRPSSLCQWTSLNVPQAGFVKPRLIDCPTASFHSGRYLHSSSSQLHSAFLSDFSLNRIMEFVTWAHIAEWTVAALLMAIIVSSWILIPPILKPTVITYPWRLPESHSYRERDKRRTVVLAGSFNPPHYGHLAMLEYLSKRYVENYAKPLRQSLSPCSFNSQDFCI